MDEIKSDYEAMAESIRQAYKGAGYVSPNPLVGSVVLDKNGRLIGKGYHQRYGQAHAEVNALKGLSKKQLEGARVFVTLEPCAHQGKTPSCAKMLAELPIKEVIYGLVDPNPLVSGQGLKILEQAGIRTSQFVGFKNQLEKVCEHFLMNFRKKRPFVTIKVASTLDGQLAHKSGESKWITGARSRDFGHYLRGTHDATLVGKNTILIDNPNLNIRHERFKDKKNKIIVLDKKGEIFNHPELNIFKIHQPQDIFVVTGYAEIQSKLAQTVHVKEMLSNQFNLKALLNRLYSIGFRSILIEGGAQTISSFIQQKEANRMYLFQAPILLGSQTGKAWSDGVIINSMRERISLMNPQYKRVGDDLVTTGLFQY